ncbi:MAG TPA: flagellar biosynthesis anti-sigma factor FlgM [Novosphingobium sp.]|nr:flagellar biosynthesis anti-sigma factor FlgM [Novosphingobium sp.]HZV11358.1 flagellar biosynthesis anti-sigma factor FlgM [Novosphingobium sp.]
MSSIGSGPGIGSGSQLEISALRQAAAVDARGNQATTAAAPQAAAADGGQSGAVSSAGSGMVAAASAGAGAAPIDNERVAVIKKAIQTGNYPVIPTKIGDAMIAAGVMLRTGK